MMIVGRLAGVYGVKGWLKVESYTDPRENIFLYSPWWLEEEKGWREVQMRDGRPQGKGLVVALEGIDDRDQAAALIGTRIGIERAQLPALPAGEYYWSDLIGLKVVTSDGQELGVVHDLMETGAHDVLVVRGERERLIPYVRERFVRRVDLEAGCIEVDWDATY